MIRVRKGRVSELTRQRDGLQEVTVEVDGAIEKAVNYPFLTGPVKEGDMVILNTTALRLKLGTGGFHFIIFNYSNTCLDPLTQGHIMKLRYTPFQIKCLCAEERNSPLGERIRETEDLKDMPVIICSLHSMLAPACAAIKAVKTNSPSRKIAYIMTDGGALPIYLSNLVPLLKDRGLIDVTITIGHAFGGDFEAVNIYSGLICARAWGADVAIVAMGPGITGTGTRFGHTGLEQGEIINAVSVLKGQPIAIPRISFADPRERHWGLSHHTKTALSVIAGNRAFIVIPSDMEGEKQHVIARQLTDSGISVKHTIIYRDGTPGLNLLKTMDIDVCTMGRGIGEDWEYFLSCSAAGGFAIELI